MSTILQASELRLWLSQQRFYVDSGYILADAAYAMPTREWVETKFSSALRSLFTFLDAGDWVEESNDCDDFARTAAFFAQHLHNRTKGRPSDTGLAFGEFWYKSSRGLHAINIFLYHEADGIKAGFYEPQTQEIIQLTREEIESCDIMRF